MRAVFLTLIFPLKTNYLLYQTKGNYSRPLFLSLLLRFLHRLRERKNLTRMFQQMVRHNHIGYGGDADVFVCGLARSSYVAQIRNAHPYYIGVFRQSQAPTLLSLFRLMSHP